MKLMRELTSSSLEADPNLGALKPAIWRTLTRSASSNLSHIPLFVRLSFLRKLLGSNDDSVTGQDGCFVSMGTKDWRSHEHFTIC